jgi:hypothetical protein
MDAQNHYNEIENLIKELSAGRRQYGKFQGLHISQVDGQVEVSGYLLAHNYYRYYNATTLEDNRIPESCYNRIEEIPSSIAKVKLDEIKAKFELLLVQYDKLRTFMSNYSINYYLLFSYGKETFVVCMYKDGVYKEFV